MALLSVNVILFSIFWMICISYTAIYQENFEVAFRPFEATTVYDKNCSWSPLSDFMKSFSD